MRLMFAAALCGFLLASGVADAACVCRCPPHVHPVRHAIVRTVHRYVRATSYVACPIALVHIVRPSCDIYSQMTLPIE